MAKKKRKKKNPAEIKIGFYKHLSSYVIVNAAMLLVTFGLQGRTNWFPIIIFWGIGLAFHYLNAFGFPGTNGVMSQEWQDKMRGNDQEEEEDELELREFEKNYDTRKTWKDEDLV